MNEDEMNVVNTEDVTVEELEKEVEELENGGVEIPEWIKLGLSFLAGVAAAIAGSALVKKIVGWIRKKKAAKSLPSENTAAIEADAHEIDENTTPENGNSDVTESEE